MSSYAFDKVAFVIGDDCHETKNLTNKVVKTAINVSESLGEKGFRVITMYGDEARAQELKEKALSASKNVTTTSVSLEKVKNNITRAYEMDCDKRPKELMLNFIAHGSANFDGSGSNHSICAGNASASGGKRKNQIYMRDIAEQIKALASKDRCENKMKVGFVDCSCKSGGSLKEFEGLGCSLSMTSENNKSDLKLIDEYSDKLKDKKEMSLSDIHLGLLVNRDYDLYTEEVDEASGKTYLENHFNNSNQISGCYDQDIAKVNAISAKEEPACRTPLSILEKKKELEFEKIEQIIKRLNLGLNSNPEKDKIATLMGLQASEVPESDKISNIVNDLIQKDKEYTELSRPFVEKESAVMSNTALNTTFDCELDATSFADQNISNALKSPGGSPAKVKRFEEVSQGICLSLHSDVYDKESAQKKCVLGKGYSARGLKLSLSEVLKIQKNLNLLDSERSKRLVKRNTYEIQRAFRSSGETLNFEEVKNSYSKTISQCLKKIEKLAKEKEVKPALDAIAFVNSTYAGQEDCKVSHNTFKCIEQKQKLNEAQVKRYFGMARGFYFLNCKNSFNSNSDVAACDDFKI